MRSITFAPSVALERVIRPVIFFKGALGFMGGMFLFLFGPIVNWAFSEAAMVDGARMPLGLDPLRLTGVMFAIAEFVDIFLEIPTGVFADIVGRKQSIVSGLIARFVTLTTMFVLIIVQRVSPQGPWVVIALLVVYWVSYDLFFSLHNGAYEAWVNSAVKEDHRKEAMAWVLARGENWYNLFFLIGAVLGSLLYTYNMAHFAYLAGMGLSIACACLCALYMPENRRADYRSEVRVRELAAWIRVGWDSLSELRNRNLMIVFLVNAAVTSLTYVVNLVTFIFIEQHFFQPPPDRGGSAANALDGLLPRDEFRGWFVGTSFVLAGTILVGNLVFSHWLSRRLRDNRGLSVRALIWINVLCNTILAAPVAAAAWIFASANRAHGVPYLVLLIGLMVIHKLAASTCRVASMTLQRDLIPDDRRETATVFSLGATLKSVVIMFLIVLGVGHEPASLGTWIYAVLAVTISTVIMVAGVSSSRSGKPTLVEAVRSPGR